MPGFGGVAHRTPDYLPTATASRGPLTVAAIAAALVAVWLIADPRPPDLAAQVYRVGLFEAVGLAIYDTRWYGGHELLGYSLLYPPLAALVGVRVLGALCALASAVLFERVLRTVWGAGPGARWGAAWFAVAAVGDIWLGRMAFALGVTFACAAALAFVRRRIALAVALAVLCAAASPVAGLLLGLIGLTITVTRRSPRALLALGLPCAAVVLGLALLFAEGGWEPYPIRSFAATAIVVLAFLWALPAAARELRVGALIYLAACVVFLLVHTPVGSNIERYAVLLAGPLLLCATLGGERVGAGPGARLSPRVIAALALIATWTLWGPVRETAAVAHSPATQASYYAPVKRFLASLPGGPVRLEVPLTRSHWEAAELAGSAALARGWEKQLDERYDGVLLRSGLTATSYRSWLDSQAVAYIALPDVPLDPSSAQEGALIRGGLPYLQEVSRSAHWRIYRVLGATPILSGPGLLLSMPHEGFDLLARSPGRFLVRVHYTSYWSLRGVPGCVARAPGGWTELTLRAGGLASVRASFTLAKAFASGAQCFGGARSG